jgi:4-hydroxybenzoate polyprenyltransferase
VRLLTLKAYLKAAHFGPTMIVTAIAFILGVQLWWEGPAYGIAFTVFLGQLLIGWSNDLYDFADDVAHKRINKPLVAGTLTPTQLHHSTFLLLPIAAAANLVGPLGFKGGLVYLLGVGCGIAYNFYFKFSIFSFLPFAIACAALPASVYLAVNRIPPMWVLLGGSLIGVAFHFLNVLKDLKQDRESNIGGLPQRVGKAPSAVIAIILLSTAVLICIVNNR